MSKINRFTSLIAASSMLIGLGVSSGTAFADSSNNSISQAELSNRSSSTTLTVHKYNADTVPVRNVAQSNIKIPALPGYVSDVLNIILAAKYDYAGGVKCGKYMKKHHPKANKYIRSHMAVIQMMLPGAAFAVFEKGYYKGSK
ncbi:hypothetical protein [Levilactobacillus brevis]|uniref:hypothetical protein n=1 Tax=Levilactobacillus brevis TaxID=1580 RepID=UPI001D3A9529|nr:hypothetical protein [Levilactobacillus brevis]MCT3583377.1 hypothetical protein [Levilactobacillus brevis]HJD99665.1 hypothetical protein [Levilactobacillus brevis]